MKIKKLLISSALAISAALLICGGTACSQSHVHSYSAWETIAESTCTHYGLQKHSCECGNVEYGTIEILPHTQVTDAGFDATCTEFGKTEGSHCNVCGTILQAQELIAPSGHDFSEVTLLEDAVCNKDGVKRISCVNDGCECYYDESFSLPELDGSEIFANAMQYTGTIQTYDRLGIFLNKAAAFLISADGNIVTSNLSLDNAASATFFINGTYYDVTDVLAYSVKSSIAVLKTNATGLPYANICKREPINAEPVYIVGFSDGVNYAISKGVISNAKFIINESTYIQHDAAMSAGYMGGALLNRFGEVIGINADSSGDGMFNLSAWVAEMDSLDYSTPISMEEYGEQTYTPTERLADWIYIYHNETDNSSSIAHVMRGTNFTYVLGHDTSNNYSFVEGQWKKGDTHQLFVRIILNNSNGTYQYNATFTDGVWTNEVCGSIDATTYDKTTSLTYDTYYGRYWKESELMALYSTAVYDTLEWFAVCLDTYFYDLTSAAFGFTNLTYVKDNDALKKLNTFVTNNGTLDGETGAYLLTGNAQVGEDNMTFSITYAPETQTSVSSTVVTVYYYKAEEAIYSASIALDCTENGHHFAFSYATNNNGEYVLQNTAWGYFDETMLTNTTQLYCYAFDGMNEYEDALLADYTSLLSYVMGLLNNHVMPSVSPELTIRDLGFLFYFG